MISKVELPGETLVRVIVKAWGVTPEHMHRALDAVCWAPHRYRWEIVDTQASVGERRTIGSDPDAVAQVINSGWAYAVYALEAGA